MVGVRCSLSCRIHTLDKTADPSSVEGPFMSFFWIVIRFVLLTN